MAVPRIQYEKPHSLIPVNISIEQLRVGLSQRIHNPNNKRSTGAFSGSGLVFFEPATLYDVVVKAMPFLDNGPDPIFTVHRRRVILTAVECLKAGGAIAPGILRPDYYCGKFRVALGRGRSPERHVDLWLIPILPEFFWGKRWDGVASAAEIIDRRHQTGVADILWVAPLGKRRGE